MIKTHDSPFVQTMGRLLIPVIQLYSVYILFHAQYSPGGGFASGVLFGASMVLTILIFGEGHAKGFIETMAFRSDGMGLLLFLAIGTLAIFFGQVFFNYASLPFPGLDAASRHSLGILGTQIGVAIDISVASISIFFSLLPPEGKYELDH